MRASEHKSRALSDPASFQHSSLHSRVLASFVCVILAAVPAWWALTTITRLSLPSEEVRAWEVRGTCPIRATWAVILEDVQPDLSFCERAQTQLQTHTDQHDLCLDWHVSAPNVCAAGEPLDHATRTFSVPLSAYENQGTTGIVEYLSSLFGASSYQAPADAVNTSAIASAFQHDDPRVVQYAPHIRIVFSLLQEDASLGNGFDGWDLTHALQDIKAHKALAPLAQTLEALERVYSVQLESQVQWYAPLESTPQPMHHPERMNETYYAVSMQDVSVFVNSVHWALDSYGTADLSPATEIRTLQMVLFVPSVQHSPLYIEDPDIGTVAEPAWLVPQWGGVVVWNPTKRIEGAPSTVLSLETLQEPMSRFTGQIRTLLGLHVESLAMTEPDQQRALLQAAEGLEWRRTLEMTRSAVETLASIVRLVNKMPSLGVNAKVRDEFLASLHELAFCDSSRLDTLARATSAHTHASRAFYDPSMLVTLYFPNEHKFAVYTPLFGPMVLPLILAVIREWKVRKRQRAVKHRSLSST